jgi:hypothetical protein
VSIKQFLRFKKAFILVIIVIRRSFTMAAPLVDAAMSSTNLQGPGVLLRTIREGDGVTFPQRGDLCVVRILYFQVAS